MPAGLNVVILAAGQGKRMHSRLPKVLHALAGRPLLAHVIARARALKPARICVVYGHGGEQVPQALAADDLTFVRQQPQLGTGHALQQALPMLGADAQTLVLYGDVPLTRADTLRAMAAAAGDGVALLTVTLDDPTGYGRIVRDGGAVKRIVEEKDATAAQRALREVNTGIMVLPTRHLARWLASLRDDNAQREYYLTDVIAAAVGEGVAVRAVQPTSAWETLGVNSKAQLAELERVYRQDVAGRLLAAGVTLADPARIDVRGSLECGRDVAIDVNCVFEGSVTLGDGVRVGANCVLRNVVVAAGSEILPFCHLEESSIGERCRLGPYARLRPGTQLAEEVHIGNFVEVKASRLGAGSKANHLSYLGDSDIGARVNVGAGTITCNYDGATKHRTVIEDDCFIGSDATLVAPVRIARGSYIGAGSTINKDTPAGQLTVARARQVSIPGWKPPKKKA